MDDRQIMENLLLNLKGACDLMMHGAIESSTPEVHGAFTRTFGDTLQMQNTVYGKMAEKGWYPASTVEKTKIDAVKQKFASAQ